MPDLDLTVLAQLPPDRQVDWVADAFLKSWQNGDRPLVSEFAGFVDPSVRNQALRKLILTEQQIQIKQHGLKTVPVPAVDSTLSGVLSTSRLQSVMPSQIGPFVPQFVLGHGASGVVYAAKEPRTGRMVAIKLPHSHLVAGKDDNQRFIREARNAGRLDHPGIVEFLQLGQTETGPYLVYEFLNGVDLRSYLQVGVPLSIEKKLQWIAEVARSLQHAHDQRIVHRDLKPSNLMVVLPTDCSDNEVASLLSIKILDFGIARLLDAATTLTNDGEMLGTPAYMSPEQASGQSQNADHRADIYSLGVIFYELLTGATPFSGSATELVNQICRNEVPLLRTTHPKIPDPVATICQRCLRLSPASRYSKISEVADDIGRFLRGQPIQAKAVGLVESAWSTWKKKKLTRVAATTLVAIVATAIVVAFLLIRPPMLSPIQTWIAALPGSLQNISTLTKALPTASVGDISKLVELPPNRQMEILESLDKQLGVDELEPKEIESIQGLQCLIDLSRTKKPRLANALTNWICSRFTDAEEQRWNAAFHPFANELAPAFEKSLRKETELSRRMVLSKLLAAFHRGSPETLVTFLDEANPNEIHVWSKSIGFENLKSLDVRWASFEAGSDHREFCEKFCVQQSNRVFARTMLGEDGCLIQSLEDREDPRLRTYCVHRFKDTGIGIAPLIERYLSTSTRPDVLYGLLMIVATIEMKSETPKWLADVEEWVLRQYVDHPDAGVHGMCRFFLAIWDMKEQAKDFDTRLAQEGIVHHKEWFVDRYGMHMAIIKGKNKFWMGKPKEKKKDPFDYMDLSTGHEVTLDGAYAIGMDELNVEQYRRFHPAYAPEALAEAPANRLSWIDGLNYCQWLNSQEKLKRLNVTMHVEPEQLKVELGVLESVKQYRLSTSEEWEYAVRGRTITSRFHGQPETPASDGTFSDSLGRTYALPNRFGLTRVIGSLTEWTMTESVIDRGTHFEGNPEVPATIVMVLRGSNPKSPPATWNCFYYATYPANRSIEEYGFRIVLRTPEFD